MPYEQPLRRWVKGSMLAAFGITICNVLLTAYGMFGPVEDVRKLFDIYLSGQHYLCSKKSKKK